ncbi:formimidoylglutamate deiminase [Knoellia subterranea]|uniref:N-formimino-L-glutamate deiminase n=1 Tax=Knoellia subterranea KCTC 19937 TaxID=1385521 RepID=A0A0A0JLB5_9MICO|nr:formimidoylglutamate deiminase [Knoellia subterranea]KGN37913.1 N-formimino-L-glutamate deiminase [Knoellia subterranea KCTC 19937]
MTGSTTYWCEHAQLPTKVHRGVRLTVVDGRFTEIATDTTPRRDDVRLRGIALPGFANAHSHAFHRMLRGRTHADGGNFWTWREQMYAVASRLDPDTYFALARGVFAEMVASGFTVVGEFHYLHHGPDGRPYDDPNAMGAALIAAAREAGIRLTLLDTCYLSGGLYAEGHQPLDEVQIRFSDGSVAAWAERVDALQDTDIARIGAAAHSVRALTRDQLIEFARVVGDRPVHAHVSEQIAENIATEMVYGRTPVAHLDEVGLLRDGFTAVHATHLTDADVDLMGRAGAGACFCPTTERDLADGIGRARDLADAGATLSLGSDQHAVIDPFEEVRGLEMHERLTTNERGRFGLGELLDVATLSGYRALGWEGGRLAVGSLADFVTIRTDSRRTSGAAPGQILFAATGLDVLDVVVHGRRVVAEGVHSLGHVDDLVAEAIAVVRSAS